MHIIDKLQYLFFKGNNIFIYTFLIRGFLGSVLVVPRWSGLEVKPRSTLRGQESAPGWGECDAERWLALLCQGHSPWAPRPGSLRTVGPSSTTWSASSSRFLPLPEVCLVVGRFIRVSWVASYLMTTGSNWAVLLLLFGTVHLGLLPFLPA